MFLYQSRQVYFKGKRRYLKGGDLQVIDISE